MIYRRQSRLSLKKHDVKQRLEDAILGTSNARSEMMQRHSRQGSGSFGKDSIDNQEAGFTFNPGSNFIELLKQNRMLIKNKQVTSHKLFMWHGILAGNLVLINIVLLCLATICA